MCPCLSNARKEMALTWKSFKNKAAQEKLQDFRHNLSYAKFAHKLCLCILCITMIDCVFVYP